MQASQGEFIWYELMTNDLPAAEAFYGAVTGWTAQDAGMGGMPYRIFSAGSRGIAGAMAVPEPGMPPSWIGYVAVDDVDRTAGQVTGLGGTLHRPPTDIPGVGRFAIIGDPGGGVMALMRGASPDWERGDPATPGHGAWRELYATDGEKAFAFYAALLGWTLAGEMDMGAMGAYRIFAIDGVQSGGIMTKPANLPAPSWLYYFTVHGLEAAIERAKAGGGTLVSGPMPVPGGSRIAQFVDPQGAAFALVAPPG